MRNWLSRNGMPVRDFNTSYGVPQGGETMQANGYAIPGQVFIDPRAQGRMNSVAARYGTRGRLTQAQIEALGTMMHEGIHQMRYGRSDGTNPGPFEEGATEAVAQDLLPIFVRQMYGHRMPGAVKRDQTWGLAYEGDVKNLRQLSVFGSGAKKFSDHAARAWRRNFSHATLEERERLAGLAMQARIAWGQRQASKPVAVPGGPDRPKARPHPDGRLMRGRPVPGRPGLVDY